MKKIFLPLFSILAVTGMAQTKLFTQAIVTTKTTIISSEEDAPPPQMAGANGEEVRVMRFGGDGETKSVTTLKGDMVKTYTESEMGRTTILRDNKNKKTTTLMEMMGKKFGFYATDEDQEQMNKEMDSLMRTRRTDGPNAIGGGNSTPPTFEVINGEGTKKIAGYQCKQALIIRTRSNGNKDTTIVWYNPDVKLQGLNSTGGAGGGMGSFMRNAGLGGLDKLEGFPMQYESQMGPTRKMIVEVVKLVTDKEIADKEFEIPKDYDVKPAKEMQGMGPGGSRGFQIRIGG